MIEALGVLIVIGLGILIYLQVRRYPSSGNQAELAKMEEKFLAEKTEKDKLVGHNKQLFAENAKLQAKLESLSKEMDAQKKLIARFEAEEKNREKEFETNLSKLETAKMSLDEERQRVIRTEEEEHKRKEEERDRLWAEHEQNVIMCLTDLCKLPQFNFPTFTNTNLPDGFDGSLKPDFMIEFLDQYVIFDAKVSKAENLQTYINNTVKTTVQKVKKNKKIATTIFLVVPTQAIGELKTFHYPLEGYHLYVVSPEALPPILSSFKKITTYELAEQLDPQQRENIIQLIAELDFHINLRNAADLMLSKMGTSLLDKAQILEGDMAGEITLRKQPMNAKAALSASEIKKLVTSVVSQKTEADALIDPKTAIPKKDLQSAQSLMMESLH